jgi:hypothetical protein
VGSRCSVAGAGPRLIDGGAHQNIVDAAFFAYSMKMSK